MTLVRRAQKLSSSADDSIDIEHQGSSKFASKLVSSSSKTSGRVSTWKLFHEQRKIQKRHRDVLVLGLGCFLAVWILGVVIWTAPPGKNYLTPDYWRRSHYLSTQQKMDLRNRFPIRIDFNSTSDMENIAHPGIMFANRTKIKQMWQKDIEVLNMSVPKFWDPSEAFGEFDGGVREFLGNNGRYVITPEEASTIGSFFEDKETIFLAIASYRDPECLPTLLSAIERAKHPERLRIAIVDQRSDRDPSCRPPSEESCRETPDDILCRYFDRIDYVEYESSLMVGPVFARHLANRMYRGEYFAMQIDSHVRFAADWDEDIIDQWKSTGNEMAILSSYMMYLAPSAIDPVTHKSMNSKQTLMCALGYEWTGVMKHIKFNPQPTRAPKIKDSPMLHPFWAAGLSFGRGHFLISVPYDHYLPFVFQGEEILQTIRAFTFGYDIYSPLRNIAYHIYAKYEDKAKREVVHQYSENRVLYGQEVKQKAYLRLVGISGTSDPSHEYVNIEEERYGLGRVRSRGQFFDTFGIHPETTTVEKDLCTFVQGIPMEGAPRSMHTRFTPFLRYDKMGIDYSRITYRHKALEETVPTPIDMGQLSALRAQLRNMTQGDDRSNGENSKEA